MSKDVFLAIADPTRRKILGLLSANDMTVNSLAKHFPVSRPAISKHLKVLNQAGLVTEQKIGRERYYHLQPEPLIVVYDWIMTYEKFWKERLAKLKTYLDKNP